MTDEEQERDAEVNLAQWRRDVKLRRKQEAINELVDQLWAGMRVNAIAQKRIEALEARLADLEKHVL